MSESSVTATEPSLHDIPLGLAEGYRSTAKWIAGALGGIPGIAAVGTIVKGPGEAGYHEMLLLVGLVAAAAGAGLGIWAFSRVLMPSGVTDATMPPDVVRRIPGCPYDDYPLLVSQLDRLAPDAANRRDEARSSTREATYARQLAEWLEKDALAAEAIAAKTGATDQQKQRATELRTKADDQRREAERLLRLSLIDEADSTRMLEQVEGRERDRRDAFAIAAGDRVKARFDEALKSGALAALLVVIGVFLLAVSPQEKTTATEPQLITVTNITADGQKALKCTATELYALKVGGTELKPKLVILPGQNCPPQTILFEASKKAGWGQVEAASTESS